MAPRVFVSYVQENRDIVARLVSDLRARGIEVWFDRDALPPGVFWREEIRRAVRAHEFFICCFSREYTARDRTYMNEELELAIAEIRLRGSAPWFIPVLLSGDVPDREIGPGRTLRDIQFVALTTATWREAINRIAHAVGAAASHIATPPPISSPMSFDSGVLSELLSEERLRIRNAYERLASEDRRAYSAELRRRLDPANPVDCRAAMAALYYIRDQFLDGELLRLARDGPVSVRRRAIFYLGELKSQAALPIISGAMSDSSSDIRAAARQAFVKIPGRKPE